MGLTLGYYGIVNCAYKVFPKPNADRNYTEILRMKLKTGLNDQPDLYLDMVVIFFSVQFRF